MRFNLTDLNSCKVPVSHADAEPPPMELLPDSNLNSPLWVLLYLIPQCPPKPHVLISETSGIDRCMGVGQCFIGVKTVCFNIILGVDNGKAQSECE